MMKSPYAAIWLHKAVHELAQASKNFHHSTTMTSNLPANNTTTNKKLIQLLFIQCDGSNSYLSTAIHPLY